MWFSPNKLIAQWQYDDDEYDFGQEENEKEKWACRVIEAQNQNNKEAAEYALECWRSC